MNNTIYKDILVSWIPHYKRAVLQQKDWWLLPIKRITYDSKFCNLLVDISLHSGSPCVPRFCICRYFTEQDKAYFCRDQFEFYPFRNKLTKKYIESERSDPETETCFEPEPES